MIPGLDKILDFVHGEGRKNFTNIPSIPFDAGSKQRVEEIQSKLIRAIGQRDSYSQKYDLMILSLGPLENENRKLKILINEMEIQISEMEKDQTRFDLLDL